MLHKISILSYSLVGLYFLCGCSLFLVQDKLLLRPIKLERHFNYTFNIKYLELNIPVSDADTLNALLFEIPNPKGLVVYYHGNADNLERWGKYAEDFTSRGYNVLMYDYRGFGKSTGNNSEEILLSDAQAMYDYATKISKEENIIIYGRSLGTGIATYIASRNTAKKLFLETPYYSLRSLALHYVKVLPPALFKYQMRTDLWINSVKCPIVIFHGTKDAVVPINSGFKLFESINQANKVFYTIPNGKHKNLNTFKAYQTALTESL